DGEPQAAIFCATDGGCELLGVTRQLVGEPWLHAPPFRYCGSVGPLSLPSIEPWQRLGAAVAAFAGLRGLFGIDAILRDGGPWASTLRRGFDPDAVPAFADIPPAGQRVAAGRPVLTLFAGDEAGLRDVAVELDRWFAARGTP